MIISKAPTLLRLTSKCNRQTLRKSRGQGQVLKNVLKLGAVMGGKCDFFLKTFRKGRGGHSSQIYLGFFPAKKVGDWSYFTLL